MQPHGDKRPARLVKLERLLELRRHRTIALVVDDDPRVVSQLREAGLSVHHATWSPGAPALGNQ